MMDGRMDELGDCNSLCVHEDREEVLVERSVKSVCYEFVRLTSSVPVVFASHTYLHAYQRRGPDGESWT